MTYNVFSFICQILGTYRKRTVIVSIQKRTTFLVPNYLQDFHLHSTSLNTPFLTFNVQCFVSLYGFTNQYFFILISTFSVAKSTPGIHRKKVSSMSIALASISLKIGTLALSDLSVIYSELVRNASSVSLSDASRILHGEVFNNFNTLLPSLPPPLFPNCDPLSCQKFHDLNKFNLYKIKHTFYPTQL